jgi:hypothetical protein
VLTNALLPPRLGLGPAILCVAALSFTSGLSVAARMRDTLG